MGQSPRNREQPSAGPQDLPGPVLPLALGGQGGLPGLPEDWERYGRTGHHGRSLSFSLPALLCPARFFFAWCVFLSPPLK